MIRLYCPHSLSQNQPVALAPAQAHYLANVMRKSIGDQILLFNETDGEWRATIDSLSKKSAQLTADICLRAALAEPDIWLVFAPIKKQRQDFLIEKATELGVSCLLPVITNRTQSAKIRKDRLDAQVIEATEQCERFSLPHVQDSQSLKVCLDNWPQERTLFMMNEAGGAQPFSDGLGALPKDGKCAILVGPEGGFDRSELDLLSKKTFVTPVSLGPRILRAETAALSALTCWQIMRGDWRDPLRDRTVDPSKTKE